MLKKILFVFFIFSYNFAHAYVTDKINSGDTLETIARRNIDKVRIKYGTRLNDYEKDLKKWNPLITDWENPPKNQLIYVDYPYAHYLQGSTWAPLLGANEDTSEYNQKFSLIGFYASSFGNYTEVTNEQTVKSGQNFPVTLGLGFSATNENMEHLVLGSFYWAQSSKGNVTGNSQASTSSFSIPGEVGGNLYYQYYLKENSLGIYSGYDYEKLNTYNTDQIITGSPVVNVSNNLHYGTIGLSKGFSLFDYKMNLKASASKIFTSTTTGTKALTGTKYIVYYTYRPEGRFNFNVFYKHHELSGTTKLSIDRIGFSIGIIIF
jgi:hypothetical protein